MAKYNVHGGHNKKVPGASKYLDEVLEDRKVKNKVINYLKAQGHTVYDCTDDAGTTQSKNLANIVAKCNVHTVTLDISIHLNAGGGTGCEVYYTSSKGKTYAEKVSEAVAKNLGIRDRGAKKSDSLYVLNHTKSPAILVECCFVDSTADKKKWNVDQCAKAIVEAVTGKAVNAADTSSQSSAASGTFMIKVSGVSKGDVLNIRAGAGEKYTKTGSLAYNDPNKYTIAATKKNGSDSWGKLKSGVGWINLEYTKKYRMKC